MDIKEFSTLTSEQQTYEMKFYINHASNLIIRCFMDDKINPEKTLNQIKLFISHNDTFIPSFLMDIVVRDTIKGMVSTNILIKNNGFFVLNYSKIRCNQVHNQRFSSMMKKTKNFLLTTIF